MVLENRFVKLVKFFVSPSSDSHAQYEIKAYADVMTDSLKRWLPITFDAFMDYRVGGIELSSKGKGSHSKKCLRATPL